MKSQFQTVDGHRIEYYQLGQGQPLFFLHGWGARPVAYSQTIKRLADRFQVIAPVMLGHGRSDPVPQDYKFHDYAEVVNRFLKKMNPQNPIVVGHSLGGAVSIYIVGHNSSINKLFLVNSSGLHIERSGSQWRNLWIRKALFNLKYPHGFRQLAYFFLNSAKHFSDLKISARLTQGLDLENVLQYIKVPTYLLWGDRDYFFPVEYAQRFCQKIPTCHLEIINNQGHDWCLVRPQLFSEVFSKYA